MSVDWFNIQENTFTRWTNDEIKRRGMHIPDLKEGLKDGIALINLLEIISGKSIGKYNKHPRVITQKMENLSIAIKFVQDQGIKLVNIGAEDIHNGNLRIILGLMWTIILRYQITYGEDGNADGLLKWVQQKIPEYHIEGFTGKDWNSGKALCALTDAVRPGSFPDHSSLNSEEKVQNCEKGMNAAAAMGIERYLLPEELAHPKVDKFAVMTYIAQFRKVPAKFHDAGRVKAFGNGLVESIVGEAAHFVISVPKDIESKLLFSIIDAKGKEKKHESTKTTKEGSNDITLINVTYTPNIPGHMKITISIEDENIHGSPFTPETLMKESLGGEGRIRVFYSTTQSTQKGKDDVYRLQRLLESKNVHLREDFEPWYPVDVMSPADRDAVFRRAGTKQLPIVFIDDEYVGDYDAVQAFEDEGKLDILLRMDRAKEKEVLTMEEHMGRLMVTPRFTAEEPQ
eukprot:c18330_g1_i1.p1 GENE.c18330_g1_i1~~c18330_g1_i1.p1  ORF type:complete len:464 (+),score=224.56 c18330_g1_i1:26-1393(+)